MNGWYAQKTGSTATHKIGHLSILMHMEYPHTLSSLRKINIRVHNKVIIWGFAKSNSLNCCPQDISQRQGIVFHIPRTPIKMTLAYVSESCINQIIFAIFSQLAVEKFLKDFLKDVGNGNVTRVDTGVWATFPCKLCTTSESTWAWPHTHHPYLIMACCWTGTTFRPGRSHVPFP